MFRAPYVLSVYSLPDSCVVLHAMLPFRRHNEQANLYTVLFHPSIPSLFTSILCLSLSLSAPLSPHLLAVICKPPSRSLPPPVALTNGSTAALTGVVQRIGVGA